MGFRRRVLSPVLIYCEGIHDQVFVRHLHQLYKPGGSQYYFDIQRGGGGGSPRGLVVKARNRPGSYESRLVVCDSDRGFAELKNAGEVASKSGVGIIAFQPCLEATILGILEPRLKCAGWSTEQYKRHLHQKHIGGPKRSDPRSYSVIERGLVDKARTNNEQLAELVRLFEKSG